MAKIPQLRWKKVTQPGDVQILCTPCFMLDGRMRSRRRMWRLLDGDRHHRRPFEVCTFHKRNAPRLGVA